MLICVANGGIANGVITRGIVPPCQISPASWASHTRVIDYVLVCAADHGMTTCVAFRRIVTNYVAATCWASGALMTEYLLILITATNHATATGIFPRSIITVVLPTPSDSASGARHASVLRDLLI
jgi:hypothetical protein